MADYVILGFVPRSKVKNSRNRATRPGKYYHPWSQDEGRFVRENMHLMTDKEMAEHLGRTTKSVTGYRKRNGLLNDKIPRFKKGHTPWNKGRKGVYTGGMAGWFPKGNKPANTRRCGEISIRQDSSGRFYAYKKVADRDWRELHRLNWEAVNGPVPEGHILVAKDGNSLNTDPDNWEPITRAEHARRNHNPEKAMATMMDKGNHPSIHLTDAFVAATLAGGDTQLKQHLLRNRPDILQVARTNYLLKRKIREVESCP